jgi:magnesium and cobalt transporter
MSDDGGTRPHEQQRPALSRIMREWLRTLRGRRTADDDLREEIEELLEETADETPGASSEERALLRNVLSVGDLRVGDVMVPRGDIVAIELGSSLETVIAKFIEAGHSRLPVYRSTLDDVAGMIHVKDLLPVWGGKAFALEPLVRTVLFVPPSVPVLDLLLQMRGTGTHMALVVDEYGGVDGLVTIEDLVEQIVGEIRDEYDAEEGPFFFERPDGSVEALGRCPVEDLEKHFGRPLLDPELREEIDTLGGLIFSLAGRMPRRGETVSHPGGLLFEVLEADPRRIKRVRVRRTDAS